MTSSTSATKRFVVVGELNPYGKDPKMVLYHLPRGASGDRLRTHLGLRDFTYAKLPKANLCLGAWNDVKAGEAARRLLSEYDVLVTLGRKVARAVRGGAETPLIGQFTVENQLVLTLPHPSGRCHVWNDPIKRAWVILMLKTHLPEVPWGETLGVKS